MLYDSNYGYPAPDARPALACLPCNAADPAEHEGWTSQCLGSSGTPLTCKRGDQVCKGCPPGTYIGEKACPSSGPTCRACCCRRRCLVCACIWLRMVACVAVRGLPQQAALLSLEQLSSAAGATAAPGSMRPLLCSLPIMLAARPNSSLPFPTPCSACRALAWLAGQGPCVWQLHRAELLPWRLWAPRLHRLPREFPLQAGLWHLLRLRGLEPQLLKEMMHGQNTQICAC